MYYGGTFISSTQNLIDMHTPTIGQMVAQDYRAAGVFRRYNIDFCCGDERTLADVCAEKGLDLADVEQALSELQKEPALRQLNAQNWTADFLADYILLLNSGIMPACARRYPKSAPTQRRRQSTWQAPPGNAGNMKILASPGCRTDLALAQERAHAVSVHPATGQHVCFRNSCPALWHGTQSFP